MRNIIHFAVIGVFLFFSAPSLAAEDFTVAERIVQDAKAVFATIESTNVIPARVRTGGTIVALKVSEGDRVEQGQAIAMVGDEKLALQTVALDSQISGLNAEVLQAETVLNRIKDLFEKGVASKARLDEAQTAYNVAVSTRKARVSEKAVVSRQSAEGAVIAPVSGRILKVPVTAGTVVMSGETVAIIAEESHVLRLRIPERHARFLKAGDVVRLDMPELEEGKGAQQGKIILVYPQIEDGRVIADAAVEGMGGYFVGERVRVWISAGERKAFIIPSSYISTRFGVDYVRLRMKSGDMADVSVQRGQLRPIEGMADGIEVLSGIRSGDVLVSP